MYFNSEGKPFTRYLFSRPARHFNRASWVDTLQECGAFNENEEVNTQAENLTRHIDQSNGFTSRQ